MRLTEIQQALCDEHVDGWLFFDHHRRDPLAYRILGLPEDLVPSRRWYYFIPAQGEPRKLVHKIESGSLDSVEGEKHSYSSWSDQQEQLRHLLVGAKRIAMQYSPHCSIPYISLVDAGTLELVRRTGVEVVSSANLVQLFEARWSEAQLESHLEAGRLVDRIRQEAFDLIAHRLRANEPVTEYDVREFILSRFSHVGLTTNHGPIVGVNANASDPHYEPTREKHTEIRLKDVVLIDLWAKLTQPESVYYDITWTGYCGEQIPDEVQRVFDVVKGARNMAVNFVKDRMVRREIVHGYEVDDAARGYIRHNGYADYFFHRTGHSIGIETHGNGANMDNLESHDDRRIIAKTCFSIEPGIYLPEFGIRSEVNVYVEEGAARVTGEEQEQLVYI